MIRNVGIDDWCIVDWIDRDIDRCGVDQSIGIGDFVGERVGSEEVRVWCVSECSGGVVKDDRTVGWIGSLIESQVVAIGITVVTCDRTTDGSIFVSHEGIIVGDRCRIIDGPCEGVGDRSTIAVVGSDHHGVRAIL